MNPNGVVLIFWFSIILQKMILPSAFCFHLSTPQSQYSPTPDDSFAAAFTNGYNKNLLP
jgi:hypothetical protein